MTEKQATPSLRRQVLFGTFWTITSIGLSQVLRFLSNILLTRMLVPELFGLMSLINVFIMGISLMSDVGIGQSLIRSTRSDERFLNTAWTIQIIRSGLIWAFTLILGYPLSLIYNEPRLIWLLPLVGLGSLLSGFNSTGLALLNRNLKVKTMVLFDLVVQTAGLVSMVLVASIYPSVFALVAGTLVSNIVRLVGSFLLTPDVKQRFCWDRQVVDEIIRFGKWVLLGSMLTFLSGQSDRLVLGKFLSLTVLGIYSISFTLANLPKMVIQSLADKVIFPSLSLMQVRPKEEVMAKFASARGKLLLLFAAGLSVLIGFGDFAISLLYDHRYSDAGWMLPIMAVGAWPAALYLTMGGVLLTLGKPSYNSIGNFFCLLLNVTAIPLFYSLWGIAGAVSVLMFTELPLYIAMFVGAYRNRWALPKQDFLLTLALLGFLGAILGLRLLLGWGIPIQGLF